MKKITFLLLSFCFSLALSAQGYETPNDGVNYSLDDLINESPETVSLEEGFYTLHQDLIISENDSLTIENQSLRIAGDVRVTIEGSFFSIGYDDADNVFYAIEEDSPYDGFRFEETSEVFIDKTVIKNGGGLKTITPNFTITNSTLEHNVEGVSTGAVISLSHGSVLIEGNSFIENETPAISSPANGDVSAQIISNYIEANGQANQNRPQLNMGPTEGDTLKIIGNTIIGDRDLDMVGGISVASLMGGELNAIIQDNTIRDNRYGINVQGAEGLSVEIIDNIIEDNNTQGDPAMGGSGISINSASEDHVARLTENEIRNNLWGVTVIGSPTVNLGDDEENPGNNIFSENGNNGEIYALYNNGPNTIMALHNCWIEGQESTLEEAGEVIVDQEDDSSLGEVIYDPINCGVLGVPTFDKQAVTMYPNPAKDQLNFESSVELNQVAIFDIKGKKVQELITNSSLHGIITLNLESGVYFVRFIGKDGQLTKKLIVK